jgi:hypothetical protein
MRRALSLIVSVTTFAVAGPASAEDICGVAAEDAKGMIAKVEALKLDKAPSPEKYTSVQDAENRILWTMTTEGHAAHPAAVCRKVVQEDRSMNIEMRLLCDAKQEACDALVQDFQIMNEQMRRNLQPR